MASQSLFLTKLVNGRGFRSFLVTAAINCTPKTRCSFCLNNGVSSSASTVFVAFSTVATSPCVIISWLAYNCVIVPIVGGSTLGVCISCMQTFGSTRLTQIFAVSSLLIAGVSVAVFVLCGSVCVIYVVFLVSICFCLLVVVPDVFVSVKMIFGNVGVLIVSTFFLADSISLASRASVVCSSSCPCADCFMFPVFFSFCGGSLVPSWV